MTRRLKPPGRPVRRELTSAGEVSQAAPAEPVALGGLLVTPTESWTGWLTISDGTIAALSDAKPSGVRAIDTNGVIIPGLIDLHGHPEYNVFAAWEPPKLYLNRSRWRSSHEYAAVVKDPWNKLTSGGKSTSLKETMARYAEVRALSSGVTAIQGASDTYPKAYEALVRNVDLWIFGEHVARSTVDFGRLADDDIGRLRTAITAGDVKAHYIHLAEGKRANTAAVNEYKAFQKSGLLGPATVVIHGTALGRAEFGEMADAGAKLVWSPQSNLRLYGETTDIGAVLDAKLPVSLGADWLPSGSRSLLEEMQVARRVLAAQGTAITARDLLQMVTTTAAATAGLDEHLGRLATGRPADITVLERLDDDGYESVLAATPNNVRLVVIGGDFAYGAPDLLEGAVAADAYETVYAWGRPMRIDTSYVRTKAALDAQTFPTLEQLRGRLIARYPQVGPIFA